MIFLKNIFIALLVVSVYACNTCDTAHCSSQNLWASLRYTSSNSNDLMYCANKKYNPQAVKIFSINNTDTTFYKTQSFVSGSFQGCDSLLYVWLHPLPQNAVFIKLSPTDTDTLQVIYTSFNSKCCGNSVYASKYIYNGVAHAGDSGIVVNKD